MGKKRIIKKSAEESVVLEKSGGAAGGTGGKKRFTRGIAHIQATYNNTIVSITDAQGNVMVSESAGTTGFSGTKKSTPFAASKITEQAAEKAKKMGLQEVGIMVKGVGTGRESAIRALVNRGFEILFIKDVTPMPHNGPRPPKPRRV